MNHREHAREIDETHDTKVDLPIDYREVQTVEEENLYGNAGVCYFLNNNNKRQQLIND